MMCLPQKKKKNSLASATVSILHNHGLCIKTKKSTVVQTLQTGAQFTSFSWCLLTLQSVSVLVFHCLS